MLQNCKADRLLTMQYKELHSALKTSMAGLDATAIAGNGSGDEALSSDAMSD